MVYAYLIDRQETVNRIKIVENKTHIEEEFDPPAGHKEKAMYCK